MAIVRNTAFAGVSVYEVDPGQITLGSTLKNVQGDASELLKRLTDKTDPDAIDHSGPGRGCVLGIPAVQQLVDKSTLLDTGNNKNGGRDTNRLQFPWFVLIPPGETEVLVDVSFNSILVDVDGSVFAPTCRLSATGNFTTAIGSALTVDLVAVGLPQRPDGKQLYQARFTGCTAGLALLIVECGQAFVTFDFGGTVTEVAPSLVDVIARFPRGTPDNAPQPTSGESVAAVQAPTASQALFFQEMDETLFTVDEAISGWHTSRLDANINGLAEFTSAEPAWGAETYTHTESALTTPSRDRFRAFTRRTFGSEPIPKIPVASHNYGGIKANGGYLVDPATPASVAARKAFAPYAASSSSTELGSGRTQCPDIPSGTLRWAVLVGQSSAAGFADVRAQVQMEASTASAVVTPTAVTGATHLAVVQGTGLAFSRDSSSNRLRVFLSQAAGVFSNLNYCLLAAAVWIEE